MKENKWIVLDPREENHKLLFFDTLLETKPYIEQFYEEEIVEDLLIFSNYSVLPSINDAFISYINEKENNTITEDPWFYLFYEKNGKSVQQNEVYASIISAELQMIENENENISNIIVLNGHLALYGYHVLEDIFNEKSENKRFYFICTANESDVSIYKTSVYTPKAKEIIENTLQLGTIVNVINGHVQHSFSDSEQFENITQLLLENDL